MGLPEIFQSQQRILQMSSQQSPDRNWSNETFGHEVTRKNHIAVSSEGEKKMKTKIQNTFYLKNQLRHFISKEFIWTKSDSWIGQHSRLQDIQTALLQQLLSAQGGKTMNQKKNLFPLQS